MIRRSASLLLAATIFAGALATPAFADGPVAS